MSIKGKGLNAEELEIFNINEKVFNSNFFEYFKGLNTGREKEFAQLRRKYQSSFKEQENFTAIFNHKLTNPNEFCERVCREVRKSGILQVMVRVNEDFEENGCDVIVINGEISDEMRLAFENELKTLTCRFKSAFQALKYMDNHIQKISAEVASSVQVQKTEEMRMKMQKLLEISKSVRNNLKDLPDPTSLIEESKSEPSQSNPVPEEKPLSNPSEPHESHEPHNLHKSHEAHEAHESSSQNFPKLNMSIPRASINILAKQLTFKSLGSAHLTSITAELMCSRCSTRHLVKSFLSEVGLASGDYYFEESLSCSCTLPLNFKITCSIIFQKSGKKLAYGRFTGCCIVDIPEYDISFSCPDCEDSSSLQSGKSFIPYVITCKSCFSHGTFQLDGFDFEETQVQEPDKAGQGKALPKNGVCKHFKNSFRWFKFPCCLRMFPCMTCHDDNTDHPAQRAELYACGFCGTLQKITNKNVCKKCGGNINGMDSDKRFWEGGKGCRNIDKMSKNDRRKFKKKNK